MERCSKCIMPKSAPNITFNKNGLCNQCESHNKRQKINWDKRWQKLKELCQKHRREDGTYDCVIAVSGGKDSHYIVGLFKEKLYMNPLCVSVDNYSWTEVGRVNIKNLSERFNVDILTFTPARSILKYQTREGFLGSLHPNTQWDNHLYRLPSEIAKSYGIRLVIWGEDTLYQDISDAGGLHGMWNQFSYYDIIFTSYFVLWNRFDNFVYAKENGFKDMDDAIEPWYRMGLQGFDFEQIDTIGYLVNSYCKFIKFGSGALSELCSDAIRHGFMSREIALDWIKSYEWQLDTKMLRDFCEFIAITEEKFWKTIDLWANKELLDKTSGAWKLIEM